MMDDAKQRALDDMLAAMNRVFCQPKWPSAVKMRRSTFDRLAALIQLSDEPTRRTWMGGTESIPPGHVPAYCGLEIVLDESVPDGRLEFEAKPRHIDVPIRLKGPA